MAKIIVNICTVRRPVMLRACLESILSQSIPADCEVEIQVIDNDPKGQSEPNLFAGLESNSKITLSYISEKAPGIPFARNRACAASLEKRADWLIFIDDDETVEPGWLNAFYQATLSHQADAYSGPVKYLYPENHAKWLQNKNEIDIPNGTIKKRASTNNVMISSHVISPQGYGLAFDNQMAFTGGSDTDFFMRLVHAGGAIVHVSDALVSEVVLPNRLTMLWRLKRQYRSSTNRSYINIKLYGYRKAVVFALKEFSRHLIEGTLGLLISPLFLFSGYLKFKKSFYHSLRHLAKGAGNLLGLIGMHPQPYQKIDGY